MAEISLTVKGMTCPHCQKAVESALKTLDGVSNAEVNLESKAVKIQYDEQLTNEEKIKDTITSAGYEVK